MAIKKLKIKTICLIGILSTIFFTTTMNQLLTGTTINQYNDERNKEFQLHMSRVELIDKVYNFTTEHSKENFSIYFSEEWFYYISFGVVTPHTCDIEIHLEDPDGDWYYIFDSANGSIKQYLYYHIPFGVALSGNYTLHFHVYLTQNLNIHINVRQGSFKCLQDILPSCEWDSTILYYIDKFDNGMNKIHFRNLKTDTYYRFYFARVSPIAYESNSTVRIDYGIAASNDINYTIYEGKKLPGMSASVDEVYPDCLSGEFELPIGIPNLYDIIKFDFGTAIEGFYELNMTIHCDVKAVNIAYAIVELNDIDDVIDPITGENQTEPDPSPETNSTSAIFSVPPEYTVGFLAFMGVFAGILVGVVLYHRKRSVSGLSI